jgi:hypothetical protein
MKKGHAGEEPRWWLEDGVPKCNVVGICRDRKSWIINWQNDDGKKQYAREKVFEEALALLLSKPPDGKASTGELVVHEGELVVTKCSRSCCKRRMIPAFDFCPDPYHKDRAWRFLTALKAIRANPDGDNAEHIATICELKQHMCSHCRGLAKKSHHEGSNATAVCFRAAEEIRADMAIRGCAKCHCNECLECDHEGREDKEHKVLDPSYWAEKYGHEGPKRMWAEYHKRCIRVLCKNCHSLEPSHSGARGADSSTLKDGSQAKRGREYVEAKTAYNNRRKREAGACIYCGVVCVEGNEIMFCWMHIDERGKTWGVSMIVSNADQCPATAIPIIDAIIDGGVVKSGSKKYIGQHQGSGCRLGCHNCHFKYETLPRMKEGLELFDQLKGVPIKCTSIAPTEPAPGEAGPSSAPPPVAKTAPVKAHKPLVVVGTRVAPKRPAPPAPPPAAPAAKKKAWTLRDMLARRLALGA